MEKGFWEILKKPIIGLAPMDGVTDAAFRYITAKYGKPHLQMTEFTSVEGISAGAIRTLQAFLYQENERPIVAQVFGSTPEAFYKAAFVVAELGFDGIDINMGCPAQNIASKGAGAGLILTPKLAQKIISETRKATFDWHQGKKIEEIDLASEIVQYIKNKTQKNKNRKILPISVKTRIGYNKVSIEEWVKYLLEERPANITIHGRTLKQLYSGNADWEAIGKAAEIIHQTETTVLGNGDIKNITEAHEKIKTYKVDGVLIGRAAMGNPWVFDTKEATIDERLKVAVEHAQKYEEIFSERYFLPMRKHLAWYCRGFPGASEIRQKLMQANTSKEVEEILLPFAKPTL